MFLEILRAVMTVTGWIGVAIFLTAGIVHIFAVKGSRQRYRASTVKVTGMLIVIVSSLVRGSACMMTEDYPGAVVDALIVAVYIILIVLYERDDDNWFNSQRKRLKKRWKLLKQRIASIKLSPTPSPMPA